VLLTRGVLFDVGTCGQYIGTRALAIAIHTILIFIVA
jgi:hypothetical protein